MSELRGGGRLTDNGLNRCLELLLFLLELLLLSGLVGVEPADGLVDGGLGSSLLLVGDKGSDLLVIEGGLHGVAVVLELVLGLDTVPVGVVFGLVLLGLLNHALDLLLTEATLVVGDGDLILLSGGLLDSRDVKDTVGIDIEADVDLGLSAS